MSGSPCLVSSLPEQHHRFVWERTSGDYFCMPRNTWFGFPGRWLQVLFHIQCMAWFTADAVHSSVTEALEDHTVFHVKVDVDEMLQEAVRDELRGHGFITAGLPGHVCQEPCTQVQGRRWWPRTRAHTQHAHSHNTQNRHNTHNTHSEQRTANSTQQQKHTTAAHNSAQQQTTIQHTP